MVMPPAVHALTGTILVFGHALFLFRGLAMRRYGMKPGRLDKVARFISHFGIPAALLTGFLTSEFGAGNYPLHVVLGVAPIITIIAFTPFLAFRRKIPWLLPGLNLVFLAAAALSGILLSS